MAVNTDSNTTFVKVKFLMAQSRAMGTLIQIQHLLKLNLSLGADGKLTYVFKYNIC